MNLGDVINIVKSGDLTPLDSMTLSDRVSVSLQTSLLGLGTVFAVLALLWGALVLFRVVFTALEKKPTVEATPVSVPEVNAVQSQVPVISDDTETAAAITAAIAVMLDKPATSFRVVSFRRSGSR